MAMLLLAGSASACSLIANLDGLAEPEVATIPTAQDASTPDVAVPDVVDAAYDPRTSLEIVQLAAGDGFVCARRIDGTVACWGESAGGLGVADVSPSGAPVDVTGITDAVDIAVEKTHSCIARKTGEVVCWGSNTNGELGDGTTSDSPTPKTVTGVTDAERVTVGVAMSCARLRDGTVKCWGKNDVGRLGIGDVPQAIVAPTLVQGLTDVTQLVTTSRTSCALVKAGDVYCWGDNQNGNAGGTASSGVLSPTKVAALTNVVSLSTGGTANTTCAVVQDGTARCWGYGGVGSLGNGAQTTVTSGPVVVKDLTDLAGVTVGAQYTCAWNKTGNVWCWGQNNMRQLGSGDTNPPPSTAIPLSVHDLGSVKHVSAGQSTTCALATDGFHVSCWGSNFNGSLGRATPLFSDKPVQAIPANGADFLAAGYTHMCAVKDGAPSCWGLNDRKQLGTSEIYARGTPAIVPGVSGAKRMTSGDDHTCILGGDDVVSCWGQNTYGELGNGQTSATPVAPSVTFDIGTATDLGAGLAFTCALRTNGNVACAGQGDNNRLGQSASTSTSTPALVPAATVDGGAGSGALAPVKKMSIGHSHSCVVLESGQVACWGRTDSGQCGTRSVFSTTPVFVPMPKPAVDVAAGGSHSCVLLEDATVRCFGNNLRGQTSGALGATSAFQPNVPPVKALAIADVHSCALTNDGAVYCWGGGTQGELGSGFASDSVTPQPVIGLSGVQSLVADGHTTCALVQDGSVHCWGTNRAGQLGVGTTIVTGTPGPVLGL